MNVIVIGGGFAGLAAATRLVEAGARVTLLERRAQLGGRAYSLRDESSGDLIDNGQHLFMGCYRATRAFLTRIGASDGLRLQESLALGFVDAAAPERGVQRLQASRLPPPLDLIGGLFGFGALSFADRLALLKAAAMLRAPARLVAPPSDWETVSAWLDRLGQPASTRRVFWHPLTLATLNDDPRLASAKLLEAVLREAFVGSRADGLATGSALPRFRSLRSPRSGARLGIARVGLSQLYVEPARRWLEARGATLRCDAPVERLLLERDRVRGVTLKSGERLRGDAVIAAVPPPALLALVPPEARAGETWFENLERLGSSPILSLHLWLDRLVTDEEMLGVWDSPLHWIGNRNRMVQVADPTRSHLSLIVSAARELIDRPADELVALLTDELRRVLPAARDARVVHARLIKEREATIGHAAGTEGLRPRCQSPLVGLFAAGDYVRTGLPATIESAVRAADEAARLTLALQPEPEAAAPGVARSDGGFVPLNRLRRQLNDDSTI